MSAAARDTFAASALARLRALTAEPNAAFRPDQLEAIGDLVADRGLMGSDPLSGEDLRGQTP